MLLGGVGLPAWSSLWATNGKQSLLLPTHPPIHTTRERKQIEKHLADSSTHPPTHPPTPTNNNRDFEELPAYLKEGLEVHFATVYDDVFNVAFSEETL